MTTTTGSAPPVRTWWSHADAWTRTRLLLALVWVLASVAAVAVGQRYSDYADLRDAVAAGQVHQVTVIDALPPGSTGYALVEVAWQDGATKHLAEVWQVIPDPTSQGATATPGDDHPHVYGDIGQQLQALQPTLQVDVGTRPGVYGDIFGWRVPVWLSLVAVVLGLAQLLVLVRGPQPRWATRWAWFWLSFSYVGAVVFLLLAGPTPGLPAPREGRRRLTGGWAFLISVVAGALLTAVMS